MVLIYRSFRRAGSAERALVLHAMGIDYVLDRTIIGWRVLVPHEEEARAREQIRLYELENQPRPAVAHSAARPGAAIGAAVWVLVLMGVYFLESRYAFGIDWLNSGRLHVASIRAGEWWRAVTALTLHSDVPHMFVNIGFGAVFGIVLAREIGAGLAWLMILIGGTAGNLMNVIVQQPGHQAVGASTAVFAALGLLAAYLWTGRRLLRGSWARRLAPVVGGIILLAWFGTGDERTDIVAHLTGFIAGFAIGAVLGRLRRPERVPASDALRQWVLGGISLAGVALAWVLAVLVGT
jgi:membrane associated rhomboid family serine protease